MLRVFVTLAAGVLAAALPGVARAQIPLQGGSHLGAECYDNCSGTAFGFGANVFWTPGRVGAVGAIAERISTEGDERSATGRLGAAGRLYAARDGFVEPHIQLAIGPSWFDDGSATCSVEALGFLQLVAGADVRIRKRIFAGIAVSGTQQGYTTGCDDSSTTGADATNWRTGPSIGAFLVFRVGPDVVW